MIQEYDTREWKKCPQGVLGKVVARLNSDDRRESFRRISGVAFVVCFVLVVAAIQWGKPVNSDVEFGNLTCAEVAELLPQHESRLLSDEMSRRVEIHLANCPACQHAGKVATRHAAPSEGTLFALAR